MLKNTHKYNKIGLVHYIYACHNLEFARECISKNIDVDSCDANGSTVLINSIKNSDNSFAELLINNGASITYENKMMETPLIAAINSNNVSIIKTLFENAKRRGIVLEDEPVIISAVKTGKIEIVKSICENGFDANETDSKYVSALHQAVADNDMEITEYLANYISVNEQDINEKTPLHYAYERENGKIVDFLVGKGANQNIRDIISFYFFLFLSNYNHIPSYYKKRK